MKTLTIHSCLILLLLSVSRVALADPGADVTFELLEPTTTTRISRTVFEYHFPVSIQNTGVAITIEGVQLSSSAGHVTIMSLDIPDMALPASSSTEVDQAVVLRVDRLQPFDPDALIWTFNATEPGLTGVVSGIVLNSEQLDVSAGAMVSLQFLGATETFETTTDADGLFELTGLPLTGAFIAQAHDALGALGSVQDSVTANSPSVTVNLVISQPGSGTLQGVAYGEGISDYTSVLINAYFPDTGRSYTAQANNDGSFYLQNLSTDGTLIVIGFDNSTGASGSTSTILTPTTSSQSIALTLTPISEPHDELNNGDFSDGLNGWQYSGPVYLVDRDLVFDLDD